MPVFGEGVVTLGRGLQMEMDASSERMDPVLLSDILEPEGDCQGEPKGDATRGEDGNFGDGIGNVTPVFFNAERENFGAFGVVPLRGASTTSGYSSYTLPGDCGGVVSASERSMTGAESAQRLFAL